MSSNGPDAGYFQSYNDLSVHELMLRDKPRTLAYKQFIENNAAFFKDKIVVDVGCGTGILSLFAAKAGAKHVYAIEASNLSTLCVEIVAHNGYSDHITVLHGRAEDVQPPDGIQADILISEWMGFYLLHESMLSSVVAARDRWLSPEGIMVPSAASIYMCPASLTKQRQENIAFWDDVYGFDYAPLRSILEKHSQAQPSIMTVGAEQLLSEARTVTRLELAHVDAEDVESVSTRLSFPMTRNGVLHGFVCWFDVEFSVGCGDGGCVLSTAPGQPETHWQQTVMLLPEPLLVSRSEQLVCRVQLSRDQQHPRRYDICIEIDEGQDADDVDDSGEVLGGEFENDNIARKMIREVISRH